ncbi:MAG: hypothetical protein HZA61_11460 [Candidatus Eisenbacteria bacterium]|uniref:Uncharacterized protein n=1 Tax=Eiseniibacteriota bacterium TaxID=2212470 RepID=A0A933W3M4_UNCEI|nr:hypothetical protein [Candidatus Eisenbacteria bacterium]
MRHWLTALLLLVLLLPASRAHAAARLHAPAGTTLHPGDRVELRWDGLDAGAREVELELSLDGGRWVRISPELHALEGRWTWRVPAVAAERARIRLRAGGERREEVAATGAEFRIEARAAILDSERRDFLGEWWPALDTRTRGAAHEGLRDGGAPVIAALGDRLEADAPVAPSLELPADDGVTLYAVAGPAVPTTVLHARSARPAFVPLRN